MEAMGDDAYDVDSDADDDDSSEDGDSVEYISPIDKFNVLLIFQETVQRACPRAPCALARVCLSVHVCVCVCVVCLCVFLCV
jgi:hypothetical protein